MHRTQHDVPNSSNRYPFVGTHNDMLHLVQEERCPYPCTCPTREECGHCEECSRQLGEPCSEERPCDLQKGLICRYRHGDSEGVCRGTLSILQTNV
ncbi:hypothetical protein NQ317_011970 [Molorchus minor]|uniref:IGFBP N-terminal domain-containing protein n=1 Tax=Molorchus minor TaxID=1323400 RepID=A0ABQ9IUU2_9CUCU|nr:hypothetical protein NQ317_011970 [Molorchus minor]